MLFSDITIQIFKLHWCVYSSLVSCQYKDVLGLSNCASCPNSASQQGLSFKWRSQSNTAVCPSRGSNFFKCSVSSSFECKSWKNYFPTSPKLNAPSLEVEHFRSGTSVDTSGHSSPPSTKFFRGRKKNHKNLCLTELINIFMIVSTSCSIPPQNNISANYLYCV